MDISAVASSASSARAAETGAEYSAKVMRKALDAQTAQGEQFAQMVAQASGVGRNIDVQA